MVGARGGWLVLAAGGAALVALGSVTATRWRRGAPAAEDVKAHLG
jgi:hypothetical protein